MKPLLFLTILIVGLQTWATAGLSIQGRLLKPDGTPVESNSVQFRVQLRSPGVENCLMFEETHTKDMTASAGLFVLNVGSGSRAAAGIDGGFALTRVFANRGAFSFTGTSPSACASGSTYMPAAQDHRKLVYQFNDGSGWETIPSMNISWAPQAIEALQVGGFQSSNLLRAVDGSGNPATGLALTSSELTELTALIGGTSTLYKSAAAGSGMTSLNGSTQSTQTFATPTLLFGTSVAPAWSTNAGTGAHTLNIPMAADTGVTAGLISKTQYDTFNSKLGTSTSFVGDVSGAYNSTSVDKIKGTAVTITSLTNGDFLKYNGTAWINSALTLNSLLPSQTGNSGKVLTTDGTNTSWTTVSGGGGGSGDVTGASNIGTAGVGVFKQETTGNLEFKKINAATSAVTITDDTAANEVDIGVNAELAGLAGLSTTGLINRTAAGTFSTVATTTYLSSSDYTTDLTPVAGTSCTAAEKPYWNTVSDAWACAAIGSLNASAITAGTIATARLGSGTADSTTYLRGDGAWATVSSGSGGFADGGNTFTATATLGANSNHNLDFETNGTTRMTVRKDGNVGIGNSDPNETLAITRTTGTNSIFQRAQGGRSEIFQESIGGYGSFTAQTARTGWTQTQDGDHLFAFAASGFDGTTFIQGASFVMQVDGTTGPNDMPTALKFLTTNDGSSTSTEKMRISNNGNVGIGTTSPGTKLDVNGDVRAASFVSTSDRRLKTNIRTVEGLEKVLSLRGVRFDWKTNAKSEVGFIAQEVEEVFPDLVFTDPNSGYKSVKYSNIVAPVVEATKELHNMCKMTESKVVALEEKVETQAREIASLREEKDELRRRLEIIEKKLSANGEK